MRSARRSAATAARCRRSAPTTSARCRSQALMARNPQVDWAAVGDVIYGCANQAGEDNRNVARMARCSPACRITCPAPRSTACAARAWTRSAARRARSRRRGAADDRRRRREHEPRAVRDAQGRDRLQPRQRGLRHHHRLALRQPADEGSATASTRCPRPPKTSPPNSASSARSRTAWRCARSKSGRGASATASSHAEIVPVIVPQRKGDPVVVERDEHPRETSLEALARLQAASCSADGTVTAGNASGVNDGACALLLADEAGASRTRPDAAGARRRHGHRRRGAAHHGHRPGAGDAQGAGADRPDAWSRWT